MSLCPTVDQLYDKLNAYNMNMGIENIPKLIVEHITDDAITSVMIIPKNIRIKIEYIHCERQGDNIVRIPGHILLHDHVVKYVSFGPDEVNIYGNAADTNNNLLKLNICMWVSRDDNYNILDGIFVDEMNEANVPDTIISGSITCIRVYTCS